MGPRFSVREAADPLDQPDALIVGRGERLVAVIALAVAGIDVAMWLLPILGIIATAIGFGVLAAGGGYGRTLHPASITGSSALKQNH